MERFANDIHRPSLLPGKVESMRENEIEAKLENLPKIIEFYERIGFVEVKAPGETPRPLQRLRIRTLRRLGFKAFVLDNPEQIGGIIDAIQTS